MDALEMIRELSEAFGPPGFEDDVVQCARRYVPPTVMTEEDTLRNLYLYHGGNTAGRPKVMLDAHLDEVGFMVQAVKPNGTLRFIPLGIWVNSNIPAHRVRVRAKGGEEVVGIISTKPPHFMSEGEKGRTPEIADMAIDVGACSAAEARDAFGIRIAAPVVPDVPFFYDKKHDNMIGKAFDDRLGCAAVLAVMNDLASEKLPVDLVGALAAQEEMHMRGAQVTARRVKPDIAIVFEGTPADDTFTEPYLTQTALHKGPMLRHIDRMMITHPRFQRFALDTAEECGIPVQEAVRTGGATNGAVIHLSGEGVPCIVIGIPVRYSHTHYGIASYEDFRNGVRLAEEIIRRLDGDVIRSF